MTIGRKLILGGVFGVLLVLAIGAMMGGACPQAPGTYPC